MVTKPIDKYLFELECSVLAKIHMVTKLYDIAKRLGDSSVLAKIHMVTKRSD